MYEDLGHAYAKYFNVAYEVSELETVPETDKADYTARPSTSRDAVRICSPAETRMKYRRQPVSTWVNLPGIVPPCPMDKNATEMREWATTFRPSRLPLRTLLRRT